MTKGQTWADHLQSSRIQGQSDLNEQTRKRYHGRKGAEEFQNELETQLPLTILFENEADE